MKNLIPTILCSIIAGSAGAATVVPVADLICSRDYNAWGKASVCRCPSELHYDKRVGSCLTGETETTTATGEIATHVMAIGGETTGVVLATSEDESYELILPNSLKNELAQAQLEGQKFTVTGDLVNLTAVESEERPSIVVTSIEYAEIK